MPHVTHAEANARIEEARQRLIAYCQRIAAFLDYTGLPFSVAETQQSFDTISKLIDVDPDTALADGLGEERMMHDVSAAEALHRYYESMQAVMPGFNEGKLRDLIEAVSEPHMDCHITMADAARKYGEIRDAMKQMVDHTMPGYNARLEAVHLAYLAEVLEETVNEPVTAAVAVPARPAVKAVQKDLCRNPSHEGGVTAAPSRASEANPINHNRPSS